MIVKKEFKITGVSAYPIKVGEAAIIFESNGSARRTSTVVSVENISDSEIKFETKNSIYYLNIRKKNIFQLTI